jgi:peptidoglycan/xylan/chitin deacetylase (PgdA/CDA1 family)|tara:strand:- start:8799 stop:9779 length:981 start_codon:yes stop_codon:yes gene_type:complete
MAAEHGVILLYHHVATDTPPSTSISPTDFRAQLEYLRDNDFSVIGLDTLIEALRNGKPVPDRAVAITFDDGYASIYSEAFPMLQSFGYPFTLFLSTDPINRSQANYMTWAQVRELSDAGVVIANHLIEHPYMLTRQEGETDQQWLQRQRVEILTAEETIANQTGQSHRYLAYPYGEFDPAIKSLLGELNFVGLAQNSGAVGYNSDFLALPRYPLASIYADLDSARTKLDTKAFNVSLLSPVSPVTTVRNPPVTLQFDPGDYKLDQIGCFANSEPIPMTWLDKENGLVELRPDQEYPGRRWRYICTAPDPQSRRYYWYSVQWIKLDD